MFLLFCFVSMTWKWGSEVQLVTKPITKLNMKSCIHIWFQWWSGFCFTTFPFYHGTEIHSDAISSTMLEGRYLVFMSGSHKWNSVMIGTHSLHRSFAFGFNSERWWWKHEKVLCTVQWYFYWHASLSAWLFGQWASVCVWALENWIQWPFPVFK